MDYIFSDKGIKRPTLNEVLAYENDILIEKFSATYNCETSVSRFIFNETKKLFWLFNESNFDKFDNLSIDNSLIILDEMWHTFILFTNDYSTFCHDLFGYYIHHKPTSELEKNIYLKEIESLNKKELLEKKSNEKRPQYEYVYDKLGEETFKTWYLELNEKLNIEGSISIKNITLKGI